MSGRRTKRIGSWIVALLLSVGIGRSADFGNEMWNWLNLDLIQTERLRFHLYLDNRVAQHRGSYIQLASPRLKYRVHPNLDLGLGFSLLHIERGDSDDFFPQPRSEVEINPRFSIGEHWRFHMRNRWEMRWNDWRGEARHRSRHRLQVAYDVSDEGFFKGWYCNNEWFVEYDRDTWAENRLIPLGASFRLNPSTTLHLFYMRRSFHRSGRWGHDHVAGTFLNVKF